MNSVLKRRLTKVALALAVAGYCSIPSALAANEGNVKGPNDPWQSSSSTGTIQGTVPKIKLPGAPATDDGQHVKVEVDRAGRTGGYDPTDNDAINQLHVGDKLTVSWDINDTEGDIDPDGLTTKTVQWMCYKTQNSASGGTVLQGDGSNGSASYTVQSADAGCYIGLKMTPTTKTGDPNIGTLVEMLDLSSADGGGASDDDIPTGPVVDSSVKVAIYDTQASTVNLLKDSNVKLQTGHTYVAQLWQDTNNNDKYDAGEKVVTDQYDYVWVFTGSSKQTNIAGGDSTVQNGDLVIPATNAEAKQTIFPSAGDDGVQGYGLSIKYRLK